MVEELILAGADIIKVGIGPGEIWNSLCYIDDCHDYSLVFIMSINVQYSRQQNTPKQIRQKLLSFVDSDFEQNYVDLFVSSQIRLNTNFSASCFLVVFLRRICVHHP